MGTDRLTLNHTCTVLFVFQLFLIFFFKSDFDWKYAEKVFHRDQEMDSRKIQLVVVIICALAQTSQALASAVVEESVLPLDGQVSSGGLLFLAGITENVDRY